jgi:hypothetical protein
VYTSSPTWGSIVLVGVGLQRRSFATERQHDGLKQRRSVGRVASGEDRDVRFGSNLRLGDPPMFSADTVTGFLLALPNSCDGLPRPAPNLLIDRRGHAEFAVALAEAANRLLYYKT